MAFLATESVQIVFILSRIKFCKDHTYKFGWVLTEFYIELE